MPGMGKRHAKAIARCTVSAGRIESAFQYLEGHLHSEINTLGYPQAALLGFCVALVAYNALAVVFAALRAVHGRRPCQRNRRNALGNDEKNTGRSLQRYPQRCLPRRCCNWLTRCAYGPFVRILGVLKSPPQSATVALNNRVSTARLLM